MDHVIAEAKLPVAQWEKPDRMQDWKNYIGDRTKALWDTLPEEAKVALALDAQEIADREDWDPLWD